MITDYYGYTNTDEGNAITKVPKVTILPTLGTHAPMTQEQIKVMYGSEVCHVARKLKGVFCRSLIHAVSCDVSYSWRQKIQVHSSYMIGEMTSKRLVMFLAKW
jgi:hypothetical protein